MEHAPRPIGDIRALYSEFTLEVAQPFPGELDVQKENPFLVYATTDTQHVIMDNGLGIDERQAALGLDTSLFVREDRYCIDTLEALFIVTDVNEDTFTILDNGWSMTAELPKELLSDREFDLPAWFELNAKEVQDKWFCPSVPDSEPEIILSDPDYDYLSDGTVIWRVWR
ncbi:hypothetical protein B0H17DRAFT_1133886 [Mycena rosella]|uniref:Uncharacterized protein n=1 Tax=Mycena rosella TaxID=1033263 RepID=A0AAD7DK08_MYCRO|nr:hypothetical protein B0H17DRAFT_1133886 [Mycena rosella]